MKRAINAVIVQPGHGVILSRSHQIRLLRTSVRHSLSREQDLGHRRRRSCVRASLPAPYGHQPNNPSNSTQIIATEIRAGVPSGHERIR
jgi:hypothetical protein